MRKCLIFNPSASTADRIKDFLLQLKGGTRCELRPTSADQGAEQIAREAVADGFERIIVAGGDGTVSQAVNGIGPNAEAVELAILPFGTGNDMARSLGLHGEDLSAAFEAVHSGRVEPIDLLRITSGDHVRYCINVANGGLGGRITSDIEATDKKRWGPLSYWMSSVSKLLTLECYRLKVTVDDDPERKLDAYGLALANGRFVGGGFPIAPSALLNDGKMDLTVIPVLPRLELMAAGLDFSLSRDHREDRIRSYTARKVTLQADVEMPFSIDGEISRHRSATFEIVPSALKVAVGETPVGCTPFSELNSDWFELLP